MFIESVVYQDAYLQASFYKAKFVPILLITRLVFPPVSMTSNTLNFNSYFTEAFFK